MEIDIPQNHEYGLKVRNFLNSELTDEERLKLHKKLEMYQRIDLFSLRKHEQIKEIDGYNYLKVSIGRIEVRLFGKWCGSKFIIVHGFKKKERIIRKKELETAKMRINSLDCSIFKK